MHLVNKTSIVDYVDCRLIVIWHEKQGNSNFCIFSGFVVAKIQKKIFLIAKYHSDFASNKHKIAFIEIKWSHFGLFLCFYLMSSHFLYILLIKLSILIKDCFNNTFGWHSAKKITLKIRSKKEIINSCHVHIKSY